MIAFIVPGEPTGKGRPRVSTRGGFARAYTPAKTRAYESEVARAALAAGAEPVDGPLELVVNAYHAVPKSWTKRDRALAIEGAIRPTGPRNDLDNTVKAVSDALNGVAYRDDGQIVSLHAERHYCSHPRVAVEVRQV